MSKDETIEHLRATVLAYSKRVGMYELKVGKLRRTIGGYINKYGLNN